MLQVAQHEWTMLGEGILVRRVDPQKTTQFHTQIRAKGARRQ